MAGNEKGMDTSGDSPDRSVNGWDELKNAKDTPISVETGGGPDSLSPTQDQGHEVASARSDVADALMSETTMSGPETQPKLTGQKAVDEIKRRWSGGEEIDYSSDENRELVESAVDFAVDEAWLRHADAIQTGPDGAQSLILRASGHIVFVTQEAMEDGSTKIVTETMSSGVSGPTTYVKGADGTVKISDTWTGKEENEKWIKGDAVIRGSDFASDLLSGKEVGKLQAWMINRKAKRLRKKAEEDFARSRKILER